MDIKLKSLSKEAIPAALEKARQYRLLNEPVEAESICLDVLEADPDNQQALIIMMLALTDQFESELNPAFGNARELLNRVCDGYCKSYYSGIIFERRAKPICLVEDLDQMLWPTIGFNRPWKPMKRLRKADRPATKRRFSDIIRVPGSY